MTEATSAQISALTAQIQALAATVGRLEKLIEKEINDLKSEQLADIKKQQERLADDQRRVWEAIRALELRESRQGGAFRVIHGVVAFAASVMSAVIVASIMRLWR